MDVISFISGIKRHFNILSLTKLQELCRMEPDDVILELVRSKEALESLVTKQTLASHWVKLLMRIFAIVLKSTLDKSVFAILSLLPGSVLMKTRLLSAIQELPVVTANDPRSNHAQFIQDILAVFERFNESYPSSVSDLPIDNLLSVIGRLEFERKEQALAKVGELINRRDDVIAAKLNDMKMARKGAVFEMQGPPPEDFRELSVVPTIDDIRTDKKPYVRPIKTKGKYSDGEEYLDVQFRLLKEDFTAPLREGIEEIATASSRTERKHNMKIYRNVRIINPNRTNGGITHRVVFDVSRLKNVPWQHSRRLIFGSLLCFSADNFTTCFFATVANRNVKELVDGIIYVRFINGLDDIIDTTVDDVFAMAESPSYFEAYRHVLEALKNINGKSLPFADYIVSASSVAKLPRYIRGKVETTEYNLSGCLTDANKPCTTTLRNIETWQEKSVMNHSQLAAVQKALTREFVIIQGPPGTGKTYVALRIAHALLSNERIWNSDRYQMMRDDWMLMPTNMMSNILLVCYTNHALDQFVEGLLKMGHDSIVRVGSRCNSEVVDRYNLRRKTNDGISSHELDRVVKAIGNATRERYELIDELNEVARALEIIERSCFTGRIIGLNSVLSFIPRHLQIWFSNMNDNTLQYGIPIFEMFLDLFPFLPSLTQDMYAENRKLRQVAKEVMTENEARRQAREPIHAEMRDEDHEMIDIDGEAEALVDRWAIDQDQFALIQDETGIWDNEDRLDENEPVIFQDEAGFKIVAKSRKQRRNEAQQQLQRAEPMTKEQVNAIRNPMRLTMPQRWGFYKYLINEYRRRLKRKLTPIANEYDECCKKVKELDQKKDELYLKESRVIAMTTTCAARYRKALERIKPKIIIIEEAAEVLEAHVITSLTEGAEHVILIGDHKQLKPKPTVYKLAKDYNLELSLFERMIRNGMDCHRLDIQHRMRPEIACLLEDIYPHLENHGSVNHYPDVNGISSNLFFIDHRHQETDNSELKSKLNQHEAEYIVALCWYLLLQGYSPNQITVLTLYTGQLLLLKNLMPKAKFEGVRVTAVDNYQGEENDIILLSLVRSNDQEKIGFVGIENRICVSLSRAKHGMFVIGNMEFMAKHSVIWERILTRASAKNQVGQSLRLYCRNHPETFIDASNSADFNAAPEGGCKRPCNYRLKCGHVCQKACHPYDEEHLTVKCAKKCEKIVCEKLHRCSRRCHYGEECGPCKKPVPKIVPDCNHEQQVPCFQSPETFDCLARLDKTLQCGHTKNIPCYMRNKNDIPCYVKCEEQLECGHMCNGSCAKCHQGRLHVQCTMKCTRPLVCSHICKQPCSEDCPPCKELCNNECEHSKCKESCGEVCTPCNERCSWQCQHKKCTMLCSEICDRDPCNEPCPELLTCNHPCIGFCGEKCPSLCRFCNKDEVEEVFFGYEDEEDARFVELIDCKHIFEARGIDKWMGIEQDEKESTAISVKQCPKCKTPIRKSKRYGNAIKKTMEDVQKVKQAVINNRQKDLKPLKARIGSVLLLMLENMRQESIGVARFSNTTNKGDNTAKGRLCHVLTSVLDDPMAVLRLKMPFYNRYLGHTNLFDGKKQKLMEEIFSQLQNKKVNISTINENQIEFLERLQELSKVDGRKKEEDLQTYLQCIEDVMKLCLLTENANLQQTKDIHLELQRLSLYNAVADASVRMPNDAYTFSALPLADYLKLLRSGTKISQEKIKEMSRKTNDIRKKYSMEGLTKEEKDMVIKAIGLRAGHWYKCPNGHVYAIGDCGGATEQSKCPDCNATIGGTQHRLAQGNAHAGEFDGSRHAAWSEGANLENFDLDEVRF